MQAVLHSRDRRGSALLELLLTKFFFILFFGFFFFLLADKKRIPETSNLHFQIPDPTKLNVTSLHDVTLAVFCFVLFHDQLLILV